MATAEEGDQTFKGKDDPFEHIDFGSFFQEYLDPGYRTNSEIESVERPSFENFLSKPSTLTDHLMWQLGAIHTSEPVRIACELVIGNLNDDGYLTATEDELMVQAHFNYRAPSPAEQALAANLLKEEARRSIRRALVCKLKRTQSWSCSAKSFTSSIMALARRPRPSSERSSTGWLWNAALSKTALMRSASSSRSSVISAIRFR